MLNWFECNFAVLMNSRSIVRLLRLIGLSVSHVDLEWSGVTFVDYSTVAREGLCVRGHCSVVFAFYILFLV